MSRDETGKQYVLTPKEMGECRFVNLGTGAGTLETLGSRKLLVHDDFLNWLTDTTVPVALRKRARMVSIQILTRGVAANAKAVKGLSAGWWRAGLGGNGGSHFYLWYATGESALGRSLGLKSAEFLLRLVRPHDDTDVRMPSTNLDSVMEFSPSEILGKTKVDDESPFSEEQQEFAFVTSAPVRIVKGYPGSGKTTTLQLAAGTGRVRRILYLTFSQGLFRQARDYFDYFSTAGTKVDVFSFESFLENLADEREGALRLIPPRDAVSRLSALDPPNKAKRFGQWEGRFDELYSELHSHGVGRALPFNFRGRLGSSHPHVAETEYVRLREGEIGRDAAMTAGSLLSSMAESKTLTDLFKGSTVSFGLMQDVNEPMPDGLNEYDSIFVDEVQDFTVVEIALMLNVACRLAVARGQMPLIVFAGDESQTVRPTDFEWGELKDLISAFFPAVEFEDFTLQHNMRSARRVADMVEASASQYGLLPRRERPGGQASTTLDHHLEGSVTYCTLESEAELSELLELAGSSANVRIVHPGARLPKDLEEFNSEDQIWQADDVKGLEYDTVIVLDAGKSQHELADAARVVDQLMGAKTSPEIVWARTAADRFRVAVSRASDTLVLVDRNGFDGYESIESLASRANVKPPAQIGFSDLEIELRRDTDTQELFNSLADELSQLVDRDLERAFRRAGSGRRRLERAMLEEDLSSDVVKRFVLACGTVYVYGVVDQLESESTRAEYVREARELFARAGMSSEFGDLERLMNVMTGEYLESPIAQAAVKSACDARHELYSRAPEVANILDRTIIRWLRNVLDGDLPLREEDAKAILASIRLVKSAVIDRHHFVEGMVDSKLRVWSDSCLKSNRFSLGLEVAHGLAEMEGYRGSCYEALGDFDSAIESFSRAEFKQDAVRCARRAGMLDRAIELDDGGDPEVTDSLMRLKAIREAMGQGTLHLVSEERDGLFTELQSMVNVGAPRADK